MQLFTATTFIPLGDISDSQLLHWVKVVNGNSGIRTSKRSQQNDVVVANSGFGHIIEEVLNQPRHLVSGENGWIGMKRRDTSCVS